MESDPTRRAAFISRLIDWPGEEVRVSLSTLRKVFNEEFPHRPRETEAHLWLLEALQDAVRQNVVKLPSTKGSGWDHTQRPALPSYISRVVVKKAARVKEWQTYPWHGSLSWIRELAQLSPSEEQFLRNVHQGLVNDRFSKLETIKRRSLELTGHEKRLGELKNGALFISGRLTLEMLGCVPSYPPLFTQEIRSDIPFLIVFENVDSMWVALKVLQSLENPPYGRVAVGYGYQFLASVEHVSHLPGPIQRVDYVGDLDRSGMQIAIQVQKRMADKGLPPLCPAPALHEKMLDVARRHDMPTGRSHETEKKVRVSQTNDELVSWLPTSVQARVKQVLDAGNHIAEEILGYEDMMEIWS